MRARRGRSSTRASRPIALPTSATSAGSHVAASAEPHGNDAEAGPVNDVPRTPAGPSDTLIAGTGGASNDAVCQLSTPARRATFWSSERALSRAVSVS